MASGECPVETLDQGGGPKETRILLIGKAGHGKSATANVLLGRKMFETSVGTRIINKSTEYQENQRFGRKLVVVDTPEFFDTDKNGENIAREISKIMCYMHQGFHALVFVMGPEKFSEVCTETRDLFFKIFGEDVAKYTIIIITHLDLLLEERFDPEDYLSLTAKEFRNMQKQCGQRVVFFNNKAPESELESQAKQVIDLVDGLSQANERPFFTNYYLRLVSAYFHLHQKSESLSLNAVKRELFRRAARATGVKRPLQWNNEKQMPVNNQMSFLTLPAEVPRKGSHPDIRPTNLARHFQRLHPETGGVPFRRYSLCTDVASMALEGRPNSADVVKDGGNITDIKDDVVDNFDDDVMKILDAISCTDNFLEESLMVESGKFSDTRNKLNDKDFFDKFVNFFSYFLLPLVNVKRNHKK